VQLSKTFAEQLFGCTHVDFSEVYSEAQQQTCMNLYVRVDLCVCVFLFCWFAELLLLIDLTNAHSSDDFSPLPFVFTAFLSVEQKLARLQGIIKLRVLHSVDCRIEVLSVEPPSVAQLSQLARRVSTGEQLLKRATEVSTM
jgi:hypothetical protein